jgi:hypothetical protein
MISPCCGSYDNQLLNKANKNTTSVNTFYVKSLASWVPHLLFQNFVPTCPHCKSKEFVDATRARFVNSPIVLYGAATNRYLDACLYPCNKCNRSFAGYNKQSMQLDASVYYAYFKFYLGPGYAVDQQLYSTIIEEAATESTAMIFRRLKTHAYKRYYSDYQLYLAAVGVNKITMLHNARKETHLDHHDNHLFPVVQGYRILFGSSPGIASSRSVVRNSLFMAPSSSARAEAADKSQQFPTSPWTVSDGSMSPIILNWVRLQLPCHDQKAQVDCMESVHIHRQTSFPTFRDRQIRVATHHRAWPANADTCSSTMPWYRQGLHPKEQWEQCHPDE